jgi:2-polyprenyl-3-methyl-5-hydroxy-6-metoxy-1,4-benzoquinol methylase
MRQSRRPAPQTRETLRTATIPPSLTVSDEKDPGLTEPVAGSDPLADVEIVTTLERLDEKLNEANVALTISDDRMRQVFGGFRMAPLIDLPQDPYSQEYEEKQFEIYRLISGRPSYEVDHEMSNFPIDPNRPFPYYTESHETVGHHLMAVGVIILTMALPRGSRILELGTGWGNTTEALARMGYDVTAVDIDPNFADLVRDRAANLSLAIDVREGGYLEIDQLGKVFDAVLFFESFHHCSDHRALFEKLGRVLAPEGRVFFAAEPITDSFPVPWGLRMDGESLWAIRANGWLELGYQESYFVRTLQRLGWVVKKHINTGTQLGVIFEARRANGRYAMSTFDLPPDEDCTWAEPDSPKGPMLRHSSRKSEITLERGQEYASVVLDAVNASVRDLQFSVQHGKNRANGTAAANSELTVRVPYDPEALQLIVECETWCPSEVLGTTDERQIGLSVRSIVLYES